MTAQESPEYVRISTAAAMTLKLFPGQFNRGEKLRALNLLLVYENGCKARCGYCGLSGSRDESKDTFIRVDWPLVKVDDIIERSAKHAPHVERVCVSMITHRNAFEDINTIISRFKGETDLRISALISPTMIRKEETVTKIREAGADMVGVAVDAATPELFDVFRGSGVKGPHKWDHYWKVVGWCVDAFGRGKVGLHLIVGLGETERQMVDVIQKGQDLGAESHLFSFFPEEGSQMEDHAQPPYGQYRRIQLARYIINSGRGNIGQMAFDDSGRLKDFGQDVEPFIQEGIAFMTSGCAGSDGLVACNRPYGNERPSKPIRNYAFVPEAPDRDDIRDQLFAYP